MNTTTALSTKTKATGASTRSSPSGLTFLLVLGVEVAVLGEAGIQTTEVMDRCHQGLIIAMVLTTSNDLPRLNDIRHLDRQGVIILDEADTILPTGR